jgi:2-polyprenyl-3-methyl-5-hydroxy-6-metoxy-1,4-benzoquinol methylase
MIEQLTNRVIRSQPCPSCSLCGAQGNILYNNLEDRLFGAWGKWVFKKCPDPQCGLVWLDPMPTEEDIGKAYQTYYTHADPAIPQKPPKIILQRFTRSIRNSYLAWKYGYQKEKVGFFQRLLWPLAYFSLNGRVWLDSKVMYLQAPYKGRLLEIGAGSGEQLKESVEFGWDAEGVDNDSGAVENALKKGLRIRCGTIEAQKYANNSFKVIIMNHVIEHIYDPLQLLRECHRILQPGGKLVIITPNSLSMGHRMFKSSWFPLDPPRHLRIYSLLSLTQFFKKNGFQITSSFTTIRNANGIFWSSRSIQQSGTCTMNAVPGIAIRVLAWLIMMLESTMLLTNPNAGEEIVAIVAKK